MIIIRVNKKKYKGVYGWDDISLKLFSELAMIEMPPKYEAFILAHGSIEAEKKESIDKFIKAASEITDKELNEIFPAYYYKVIRCLTNIPDDVLSKASTEDITGLYDTYFKHFIITLIYHVPMDRLMGRIVEYIPPYPRSFKVSGSRFYLPQTVRIMDQDIPLADEPIISYTEAGDIFRNMRISKDDVKRLALFMAIYCRKRGEKYNEKTVLQRSEHFMDVKMSIVWSVFFYTVRRMHDAALITRLFGDLPRPIGEIVYQLRTCRSLATGA